MNGLLIEWGTKTDSSAYGTVKFDTNAVFTNTPIITATAFKKDEVGLQVTIQTSSKNNFTYWTGMPSQYDLATTINWIAIGY